MSIRTRRRWSLLLPIALVLLLTSCSKLDGAHVTTIDGISTLRSRGCDQFSGFYLVSLSDYLEQGTEAAPIWEIRTTTPNVDSVVIGSDNPGFTTTIPLAEELDADKSYVISYNAESTWMEELPQSSGGAVHLDGGKWAKVGKVTLADGTTVSTSRFDKMDDDEFGCWLTK